MPIYRGTNADPVDRIYHGGDEVRLVYVGTNHTPAYQKDHGPLITNFGASDGQTGNLARLTINATRLPISPTVRGTLTARPGTTLQSWHLSRVDHAGNQVEVARGGVGVSQVDYTEPLAADLHPPASGWQYHLLALDNAGESSHATCTIRVITAPTLTAFMATPPANVQAPGVDRQCSFLTWTGTDGDPVGTWSMNQTGRIIAALPSSRHLSAAQGRATGNHRTKVCVATGGGLVTTITLGVSNEAGNASMLVPINWS